MRAAGTGPAAASHPASPSAGPGHGSPAGRSGGWSAPGPRGEKRRCWEVRAHWICRRPHGVQSTLDGTGQDVCKAQGAIKESKTWPPSFRMKALFEIRCDSTCLNSPEMIQDTGNGGHAVMRAVSGQKEGRERRTGRNKRKDHHLLPIFKVASST